jgi:hypothetical protein
MQRCCAAPDVPARRQADPADTIKARLQLQGALQGPLAYRGTLHAVRKVHPAAGQPKLRWRAAVPCSAEALHTQCTMLTGMACFPGRLRVPGAWRCQVSLLVH